MPLQRKFLSPIKSESAMLTKNEQRILWIIVIAGLCLLIKAHIVSEKRHYRPELDAAWSIAFLLVFRTFQGFELPFDSMLSNPTMYLSNPL
jgi:hypothetical protein